MNMKIHESKEEKTSGTNYIIIFTSAFATQPVPYSLGVFSVLQYLR